VGWNTVLATDVTPSASRQSTRPATRSATNQINASEENRDGQSVRSEPSRAGSTSLNGIEQVLAFMAAKEEKLQQQLQQERHEQAKRDERMQHQFQEQMRILMMSLQGAGATATTSQADNSNERNPHVDLTVSTAHRVGKNKWSEHLSGSGK